MPHWTIHLRAERESARTVKSYTDGVRAFLDWCAATGTPPDLEARDNKPATLVTRQLAVRRFSAWLADEQLADSDRLTGMQRPSLDVPVMEPLTDEEITALIRTCSGTTLPDRRDEAIVRLMTVRLADLMPLVDAIGKLGSDVMGTGEYSAVPRRWATGAADGTGLDRDQFQAVQEHRARMPAMRTVVTSATDAKFGTFEQPELGHFVASIGLLMSQVASIGCLPSWHVQASVANPISADATRASESRLTTRADQRQRWFTGAYEDLMRLAVRIEQAADDPRLDDLVTSRADAAPATIAQTADAQAKLIGAGITDRRAALEALGMIPLEIDRQLQETNT